MDSPIRQYLKQKDYRRHKLFRKMKRRQRAEQLLAIDAPMKELKRRVRLKRFGDGKDIKRKELPYPLRTSADYDDNLAYQSDIVRDPKTGHMMSTTQEPYPQERTYLKSPIHPTYGLAIWGDMAGGYQVYRRGNKDYAAPNFAELMYTKPPFKYRGGKDSKRVYEDQTIDGVNLWRDDLTGQYFYQEGQGERRDLSPVLKLNENDPTTWSFVDTEGRQYNPRREYTGPQISQTTDAQRVANEVRNILNTRTWRSDVADLLHNLGEAASIASMFATPEGGILMRSTANKLASRFTKIPKITYKNASAISDAVWDEAYINAIKSGNNAEILRLRDLHFKSKSPGNIAVDSNGYPTRTYHVVNDYYDPTFNEFNPNIEGTHTNIYTTDDKYMAGTYTSKIIDDDELDNIVEIIRQKYYPDMPFNKAKKKLLKEEKWLNSQLLPERRKLLYTYLLNPVVIDSNGGYWNHIPLSLLPDDVYKNIKVDLNAGYLSNSYSTRSLERALMPTEYDIAMGGVPVDYGGFIAKRIKDYGGSKRYMFDFKPATVYSVKDPAKLKLADAITYDDAGNMIPLSKRDNFNIKDLRYGIIPAGFLTTTVNQFNSGKDSGIHIKPENRGKFTALKKRTGKSASWFKAHGTPALKKMATFALNARKWEHK